MRVWYVKRESERRIRLGHPWVFSSDLSRSPKGIEPGEMIELRDYNNNSLGWGYGHPNSLISFRFLSRRAAITQDELSAFLGSRLEKALSHRRGLGLHRHSFRWVFAEADQLPGLIVDFYRLGGQDALAAVQISTAGMERMKQLIVSQVRRIAHKAGLYPNERLPVLMCGDSSKRSLEGLAVEAKHWYDDPPQAEVQTGLPGSMQTGLPVLVSAHGSDKPVELYVDFLQSQKTGVFLDQRYNISILRRILEQQMALQAEQRQQLPQLKVLDLFCYLGHWSAQVMALCREKRIEASIYAVDSSQKALEWSALSLTPSPNTRAEARTPSPGSHAEAKTPSPDLRAEATKVDAEYVKLETVKMDILKDLNEWPEAEFDVVVCDPPALAKKRKDLPLALKAYTKLNEWSLKKVKSGGLFVTCSCSGLVSEKDFELVLSKAETRAQRRVEWITRGGLAWDHPILPAFPEGNYLKAWFGRVVDL